MTVPSDPPIFHITHLNNLSGILGEGALLSDSARRQGDFTAENIGHLHIKERRHRRNVPTMPEAVLSDFVPFNFCPRSVMLYVVHRGHDDYRGGQDSIVHLVSSVVRATSLGQPWAFTDRHAELGYAEFFNDLQNLDRVHWQVMKKKYWKDTMEERQAEFLVHQRFPWAAVTRVVVKSDSMKTKVQELLLGEHNTPPVAVESSWYY